ncbi:MAG TPA: sensor histidine kinase [Chryseolinea sp.]|nr:sensor histidine kinase [Chryseolinea sp.]HPH45851.1 sensor histidine kinase [Chryseolinea sp.]HPM31669.1 sensor histidine kinase [Chryseolinea sp.]
MRRLGFVVLMSLLSVKLATAFASGQQPKVDTLKAHRYIEEAKNNFDEPRLADSLGHLAFQLAGNYFPYKAESAFIISSANLASDFDAARQWADTSVFYYLKNNNYSGSGYSLRAVGTKAQFTNRNDLAIRYLLESARYFDKARDTVMVAQNYVSLSLLYHNNLLDFENGLQYGHEGLKLIESQHTQQPILLWRAINAIAISYDDSREWDKALAYHERNLGFDDPFYKSSTLNNIGNTLRKKGELAKAETFFQQSLALIEPDDYYHLATDYLNLTQVNSDLQNMKKAFLYNDSSLYYANKSNNTEKLRDAYEIAYQLNQKQGNFKKAFEYVKHLMEIKDSVLNKDKAEIIYEMESRFQSEKKELQIVQLRNETLTKDLELQQSRTIVWWVIASVLLVGALIFWLFKRHQFKLRFDRVKENEELQRQRFSAVIEAEENERARVAKDLHDGLGQLLSAAKLSLTAVSLPSDDMQGQLLNNSIQVLDQATQEVRSISHNLMPVALMELGLKEALEDMILKINESKLLNIQFLIEGIEARLPAPIEVAVYRIIQEVINNMIKHSRADRIEVNVLAKGNTLHLSISDNGVGFEKEMITKSKGLGWKSVFSRIAMLKGNIEVDTQPGKGTNINIQFAIA